MCCSSISIRFSSCLIVFIVYIFFDVKQQQKLLYQPSFHLKTLYSLTDNNVINNIGKHEKQQQQQANSLKDEKDRLENDHFQNENDGTISLKVQTTDKNIIHPTQQLMDGMDDQTITNNNAAATTSANNQTLYPFPHQENATNNNIAMTPNLQINQIMDPTHQQKNSTDGADNIDENQVNTKNWLDGYRHSHAYNCHANNNQNNSSSGSSTNNNETDQDDCINSNITHDNDDQSVRSMALKTILAMRDPIANYQFLTSQTLCPPTADFQALTPLSPIFNHSTTDNYANTTSTVVSPRERLIRQWTHRLLYLSIFYHHWAPALREYEARRANNNKKNATTTHDEDENLLLDFECRHEKFIVTHVPRFGMGASFRMGVTQSILFGLALDRITLFVNRADNAPLHLTSCPRRDLQCIFWTTSPCTLLRSDIDEAPKLPEQLARVLRRQGWIPSDEWNNQTQIFVETRVNPAIDRGFRRRVKSQILNIADQMIKLHQQNHNLITRRRRRRRQRRRQLGKSQQEEQQELLNEYLQEALKRIQRGNFDDFYSSSREEKEATQKRQERAYGLNNRWSTMHHVALLYALRPNPFYAETSWDQMQSILSSRQQQQQGFMIGLPIRGSDKCLTESTCHSWDTYLDLSRDFMKQSNHRHAAATSLLITTEDAQIYNLARQHQEQISNNKTTTNDDIMMDIILNPNDQLQSSGLPQQYREHVSADSVMLSSLVAIRLQLQAHVALLNCCSNFHALLMDLRTVCGGSSHYYSNYNNNDNGTIDGSSICLQEYPNPRYNICCQWTRTRECDILRQQQREGGETR